MTTTAVMGSSLLAFYRLFLFTVLTLICAPLQSLMMFLRIPFSKRFPHIFHGLSLKLLGIKIRIKGKQATDRPMLFMANHTSYMDIQILGSIVMGSFVSKAEVAKWPIFGYLATLQRTVFIERRRTQTGKQKSVLEQRLDEGDRLILFPEGTSSDGNRVLPFKSALFSVAENKTKTGKFITVQPVSVAYVNLDGLPVGYRMRPFYGWYGDMEMGSHLWKMLGLGSLEVVVEFLEPVTMEQFDSRKAMAAHCQRQVADSLAHALTGRPRFKQSDKLATA